MGLAHHYARKKATLTGQDPDKYFEPLEAVSRSAMANGGEEPMFLEYAALAREVVSDYIAHWQFETWEPLYVEQQFRSHVTDDEGNRHLYTQRADLIIRDPATGKIYVVDHKTTGRITTKTVRRYTLSGQFLGFQVLGKKAFGDSFGGLILNMIQLPGKDPTTFKRPSMDPAPYGLRTLKQTLLHAEGTIKRYQHLKDPLDWPGVHHETACWTPYGMCPFHETCQFGF